jgi:hypothetical protein
MLWTVVSLSSMALATESKVTKETTNEELSAAKVLSFLVGKWDAKIVIKPNEMTPDGVTGTSVVEYRPFGQALEGLRISETTRGHNEEREIIVYRNEEHAFLIFSVSQNGTFTQRTLTRFGDVWTVEYNGQFKDKEFIVRGVYKAISHNEVIYSSEIDVENTGFKPYTEVTFTRISKN